MDMKDYSEARFKEVKEEVTKLVSGIGFKADKITFVPISALKGDNAVKKSDKMPWYNGPTLLEAMDNLTVPEKPIDLPLRLPIQDVYVIQGIGAVPVGRVETGVLKVGDKVIAVPGREGKGVTGELKTIEMHHEQLREATPGDNIGFNVRGWGKKDVARGDVVGKVGEAPPVVSEFTAHIVVLNHPSVVHVGYAPVLHIHTSQVPCQITEITKKINPKSGETVEEKPDFLKNGDAAIVKLKPIAGKSLVIEKQADIPKLSRFALRDMGQTVAAGMCIDYVKKEI
jgi:elongation factor 1-alpha